MSILFSSARLGSMSLQNHLVMAPMTRSRALDNVPNDLMATYYRQRASAGLIITEGTSPSPNGLGYPRIPGVFSAEQVAGWKGVTEAIHVEGARIFCQLMHTGRVSHPLNLPRDARVLAPSAIAASEEMYTDQQGMQPLPVPEAMIKADIDGMALQDEHVRGTIALLLIAGIDTTWSAIGASLWHLAQHPEDRARWINDPDVRPFALEEFLRFYAPVTMARLVAKDVEVDGCPMKAGDWTLLS